ncbi:MAG: hypothetical protein U0Z75_01845 [Deinococcaceae bacterium]
MSKSSPYSDLQGKSLEEIIVNPALWSMYMDLASRGNDLAISLPQLLSELQNIDSPIARAREAHVMLGLNRPFQEIEDLLTPFLNYPLCEAMYLMAVLTKHTEEAYAFVARQTEFVTPIRTSPSEHEAQLRWDFARGQGLERHRNPQEAIRLLSIAHRSAVDLRVHSIATFAQVKLNALSINTPEMRILTMRAQLEQAEKVGDIRVIDSTRYDLCMQHAQLGDFESILEISQEMLPSLMQQHLVQGTKLLLGLPPSEELPSLAGLEGVAFAVMIHVLSDFLKFKRHIDGLRSRRSLESLAKKILSYAIVIDTSMPVAGIIATCLQAMTSATSGDTQTARNMLSNAVELTKDTAYVPKWSQRFTSLTEFFVAYKEQKTTHPQFGEDILVGLEKSTSFQAFVANYCPDAIFQLHNEQRTTITERMMGKVFWFEPIAEYLSEHPDITKLSKNTTESNFLKSKIDILEKRLEEAKSENDIRTRDCTLYGLCVLAALNDDYPSFMKYANGFMDSELKNHMILFAKFYENQNPGYQLPESFGPEDQPFYSATRLMFTFKQYNWHYRNSHHNPEYDNMRNSILNWEIPETLDVPLTNLISLTLKILVYLMNWDVKTPKPLMQKMRDIMKTTKLTETERYYVWLAEGMLDYQTRQRMKPMYVAIIEKGIERQKSFQWFVVETCPQILIYLEKHGKSKVVKKLAKDTLKRWAGPSGPRWA